MNVFLQRHAASVIGVLHGFDRLLFRGTQRLLATAAGLMHYLWSAQVLLKDFGDGSQSLTEQVRSASEQVMRNANRPLIYLRDASASKEKLARQIARDDGIKTGPVCLLSSVEPCWSYEIHRSRSERKLILEPRYRKCLHLYHYLIHPQLGLMHARVQTWLPFTMKLCVNGRQWLGRSLEYYGSVDQSEWASDVMLKIPASVGEVLEPLGQAIKVQGRRYRGLRVMEVEDGKLLAAVGRGEFAINGFRNRDLRVLLMGAEARGAEETRRRSGRISRRLALLRAHGLIRRVSKTRRWMLTGKGQQVVTLLSVAKAASAKRKGTFITEREFGCACAW